MLTLMHPMCSDLYARRASFLRTVYYTLIVERRIEKLACTFSPAGHVRAVYRQKSVRVTYGRRSCDVRVTCASRTISARRARMAVCKTSFNRGAHFFVKHIMANRGRAPGAPPLNPRLIYNHI